MKISEIGLFVWFYETAFAEIEILDIFSKNLFYLFPDAVQNHCVVLEWKEVILCYPFYVALDLLLGWTGREVQERFFYVRVALEVIQGWGEGLDVLTAMQHQIRDVDPNRTKVRPDDDQFFEQQTVQISYLRMLGVKLANQVSDPLEDIPQRKSFFPFKQLFPFLPPISQNLVFFFGK